MRQIKPWHLGILFYAAIVFSVLSFFSFAAIGPAMASGMMFGYLYRQFQIQWELRQGAEA